MEKKEYYLFKPTKQDMKIEYPELRDVKEFMELKTSELKFVWYYANRTSPFFETKIGDKGKIRACLYQVYGSSLDKTTDEYKKYINGNFPQKIKAAIEKMKRYSVSARFRAKMATEKVYNILEESLFVDDEMQKSIDTDLEMRKKYIDLSIKVTESIPTIVSQIEDGFGIKSFSKSSLKEKEPTLMDVLHMEDE